MRPASFAPQRNVDDREGLFQDGLVDWACLVALKDPIALRRFIEHDSMFRAEGVDSFCQVELLCS